MATYHVDLINGNDANDGSSWAQAWLTLTKVYATAADDDTIKFAKNPLIESEVNAQWTNNQGYITTESPLTLVIDNAIGNTWTSSANVTGGTYTQRKIGANCQQLTFASAFTTGKAAYKTLPSTLDLSSYSKISFWINLSVNYLPANTFKICLCSDSTGDTVVNTLYIPAITAANKHIPVLVDNSSALGGSINSIALYCDSDPGTAVIRINNIFACNDLSLLSFVGKNTENEPEFYPIMAVDNSDIYFDRDNNAATNLYPYTGTTESIELKIINGAVTKIPALNSTSIYSTATTLNFLGGYNMATDEIDGLTVIDGRCNFGTLFNNSRTVLNNFMIARYYVGFKGDLILNNCHFISNNFGCISALSSLKNKIYNCIFCSNTYGINQSSSPIYISVFDNSFFVSNNYGINLLQSAYITISNSKFRNPINATIGGMNISIDRSVFVDFINCTIDGGNYCFSINSSKVRFIDCNIGQSNVFSSLGYGSDIAFINSDFNSTRLGILTSTVLFDYCLFTDVFINPPSIGHFIKYRNHNKVLGANSTTQLTWQTTIKQGTDPGAWLYKPHITYFEGIEDEIILAEIAVEADIQTTVRTWIKRYNVSSNAIKLKIKKDVSLGIAEDVVTTFTDSSTSWTEIGVSVIPTSSGVIRLAIVGVANGESDKFYIGSLSITS